MSGTALIIDDHPLYRDALQQVLSGILGDGLVRVATSAEEGLRTVDPGVELRLVLLDFTLPGMSGTEAVAAVLRRFPGVPVLAVSASDDRRDATATPTGAGAVDVSDDSPLTPRQLEILAMLHLPNKRIARRPCRPRVVCR